MSIYYGMSGKESNLEQSYIMLDLAGQVAARVSHFLSATAIDDLTTSFAIKNKTDRLSYVFFLFSVLFFKRSALPPTIPSSASFHKRAALLYRPI